MTNDLIAAIPTEDLGWLLSIHRVQLSMTRVRFQDQERLVEALESEAVRRGVEES